MPKRKPSPTERNGRDDCGRFTAGNQFAVGNPHHAAVGKFRSELLATVSLEDLRAVVRELVAQARQGSPWACRLLLEHLCGKPAQAIELEAAGGTLWPRDFTRYLDWRASQSEAKDAR